MSSFVHLRLHSYYSLLKGASSPSALIQHAASMGSKYLSLTDFNALYGAIEFYLEAKNYGIHPIIGAELDIAEFGPFTILVKNRNGYSNLTKLITLGRTKGGHGKFLLHLNNLRNNQEDLVFLYGGKTSVFYNHIENSSFKKAKEILRQVKEVIDSNFYLEVQHFSEKDENINIKIAEMANKENISICATNNVYFSEPEDYIISKTLHAIDQNSNINSVKFTVHREQYLKPEEKMEKAFSYLPEALQNTLMIAESCKFEFKTGTPIFPKVYRDSGKSADYHLRKRIFIGIRERYSKIDSQIIRRARKEYQVIKKMGFADYFLIVSDIVSYCREKDIPCVGRGSAGDSLVSYLLGITQVDPIPHRLYFERFLSLARKDPPDIDLDIDWRRRDEVIEFVYRRFGKKNTAMICTFNTFKLRSSIRDTAKVFGFPEKEIKTLLRFLPRSDPRQLKKAIEKVPVCKNLKRNISDLEKVFNIAGKISNFPRHLSIHAGGLVIAPANLTHYTALEPAAKGITVTQYDMRSIEALGLVKMDLLGVRSLSVISETIRGLHKIFLPQKNTIPSEEKETLRDESTQISIFTNRPNKRKDTKRVKKNDLYRIDPRRKKIVPVETGSDEYINRFPFLNPENEKFALLDVKRLPANDPAVTSYIGTGQTMGCFQMESPAMRSLLSKMEINGINDVIAAVALIRPGAADSGMKDKYILRHRGLEPVTYPAEELKPILKETFGIVLYQEQIMQIAAALAGFSLAEGEILRRAMTKAKKHSEIAKLKDSFIEGILRNGFSVKTAEQIWLFLANFAGYGFNKAHAAIYGLLAYQTAFLKYYFPVPYMTAVINNGGGFYHTAAYVEECRRLGMIILPPDINLSEGEFTWEGRNIRVGLNYISELTEKTQEKILRERCESGSFIDYYDFVSRVKPGKKETKNLIKAGALRSLNPNSPLLLLMNQQYFDKRKKLKPNEHFPFTPYSDEQQLFHEMKILGFAVTDHPLRLFEHKVSSLRITYSYQLEKKQGQNVTIFGWRIASRRLKTRKGEYMQFITLEDRFGLMEIILFPEIYREFGKKLIGAGPFLVKGNVVSKLPGDISVVVNEIEPLHKQNFFN